MKKLMLILLITFSGIFIYAQETVLLSLNPEKGKTYHFQSSSDQTIVQTINGSQQTTTVKSISNISIKMVDKSADFIIAEFRFDSIRINTNAMGKESIVNSASEGDIESEDASEVLSYIMNRLSKNPIYAKIAPNGKILELINYKMVSDIVLKDTARVKENPGQMTKMQIRNTMNEKSLTSDMESITCHLPAKEVKTGDTWEIMTSINPGGMAFDITTSYKFDTLKDNYASVTEASNIQASPNAEPMKYGPAVVSYGSLNGIGKTNLVLDSKTGLVKQNSSKIHISGNMDVSVQGMNLQMPIEIDGNSSLTQIQ